MEASSPPETTKRSYALAVTLVLLTASLIGNVFLFSLHLQDKQQDRVDKGKAILQSMGGTSRSLSNLEALLSAMEEASGAERDKAIYDAGAMFLGQSGSFLTLMDSGKEFSADASTWPAEYKKTAVAFMDRAGKDIVSGTKEDKARLAQTAKELTRLLGGVDFSIDSKERALTIQADKGWPDICLQMLNVMEAYLKS
ncbi:MULTISPECIES: hypothetical protein [unclassified Paenibacillus]|uniref:hypothetical protein n=1 Tax=unclassified Paenibacillus TaxID=185978 RepID=UPI000B92C46D|nr:MULTISPECIES: hypothetical protein [unclassified Paenibacillus]ASS66011.1 hypothetical protein CIC07_07550 [Paenibacillus sp. RUD330]